MIRIFTEIGGPHHRPHFHAYYQEHVAIFGIDLIDLLAGGLPRRQQRLVEACTELHQVELRLNWERLQSGLPARPIEPLR